MFVKGNLSFSLDGEKFEFLGQSISLFGVTGLPWGRLNEARHFGREATVSVRIMAAEPFTFEAPASILRERTAVGEHMGLKFKPDAATRAQLAAMIARQGHTPTDYLRKYPRIPSDPSIGSFPLRVLATACADSGESSPIILDVGNLSPNGVLLYTENPQALTILPGRRLKIALEPRGEQTRVIRFEGLVCRIVDELNSNGNVSRYFGVKFTRVDEPNRIAFLALLKDILTKAGARNGP